MLSREEAQSRPLGVLLARSFQSKSTSSPAMPGGWVIRGKMLGRMSLGTFLGCPVLLHPFPGLEESLGVLAKGQVAVREQSSGSGRSKRPKLSAPAPEGTGPPHLRAAWDQSAGVKAGFQEPDSPAAPPGSAEDLCAWPGSQFEPPPAQPGPGRPKRRRVGCRSDSRPLGHELTGLHACSPADSACPRSACRTPPGRALKVARGTTAARTHLPLGSRRCAPRPPALSPVLAAASCEAARRASCAKACGEGEG